MPTQKEARIYLKLKAERDAAVDALEKINAIMWNNLMVKGREFDKKQGFEIMKILNDWVKNTVNFP